MDAVSPLDGRYSGEISSLPYYLSESALMRYRLIVEIEWLMFMSRNPEIKHVREITEEEVDYLNLIHKAFDEDEFHYIQIIEHKTKHDVKAVEYYLKEKLEDSTLKDIKESIHFACTSEDINNIAYAIMIRNAIQAPYLDELEALIIMLLEMINITNNRSMLAHTHGQPASPTTMGKELNVFIHRLLRQQKQIRVQEYLGKFNGATGNYNAHLIAYPNIDWHQLSKEFVEEIFLITHNPVTTQIESHDYLSEIAHNLIRINTILIDMCQDIWLYISKGYLSQKISADEIGSSTMPHKVNPINFENAEANLGISNALLNHLAMTLPISRMQRDLSDSSALRNFGVGIAHSYLAITSIRKGLNKIIPNNETMDSDLLDHWEVLGEAYQTVLRKNGVDGAYEKLKERTRGKEFDAIQAVSFINSLDIPEEDRYRLKELTPLNYIGLADKLAKKR